MFRVQVGSRKGIARRGCVVQVRLLQGAHRTDQAGGLPRARDPHHDTGCAYLPSVVALYA